MTYEDFCYWGVYLGFARRHKLSADEAEQIVPDPTDCVERMLPLLFPEGKRVQILLPDLMARRAALCPVFEGGSLYVQIQQLLLDRQVGVGDSPILAWRCLQDRGLVKLVTNSDAGQVWFCRMVENGFDILMRSGVWRGAEEPDGISQCSLLASAGCSVRHGYGGRPNREWFFLATHNPMRMRRVAGTGVPNALMTQEGLLSNCSTLPVPTSYAELSRK